MNRSSLTDTLRGFTILQSLNFSVELDSGVCTLILDLADSEVKGANGIRAKFEGVSNLSIQDLGGGLTQLLLLTVEDIRDRQLDRINYQIHELERDSLSFVCRTLAVIDIGDAEELMTG